MGIVEGVLAFVEARPRATIALATALTLATAFTDWIIEPNVSLGFLYIFPIMLMGAHLTRTQIAAFALLAAIFREIFSPFRFEPAYIERTAVVWTVFTVAGVLISEIVRNRRLTQQHLAFREQAGRRLLAIVETSPVAIVTFETNGRILLANQSARSLLGLTPVDDSDSILRYLDTLAAWLNKVQEDWRTDFECLGRNSDGDLFRAHVWLSAYRGDSGLELAAVIWDASEQLRGREEAALDSMAVTSRVLLGAVSHEVRNLAGAATTLHSEIAGRNGGATHDPDFQTLGAVLRALGALGVSALHTVNHRTSQVADLRAVLDDFRIIIGPWLDEAEVQLVWEVPDTVTRVVGEHSGLLQVLLNLANNSVRAMRNAERRVLYVEYDRAPHAIALRVQDTGHGVADPQNLFKPFASSVNATGLGLYVSRAIVRSFGGDLTYEPQEAGACFVVQLSGV